MVMKQHILDIISYLFDKGQNFGIFCKIEDVTFNPELPEYMRDSFSQLTLFFLAGYTYESAYIEDEYIIFEAGFGNENFGSVVSVPLLSIMQIIVDETPIFINLSDVKVPLIDDSLHKDDKKRELDEKSIEKSMSIFLSNPENEKFFKK
jgi:hypothetical protein